MNADQVVQIYRFLLQHDIGVWLQGGWGIDALLGRQTRDHKDLDLLVKVDDVFRLRQLLEAAGFSEKYTWEENLWVTEGGKSIPTAFVLAHRDGRELDFHAARFDDEDGAVPAWDSERVFRPVDLAGEGTVTKVRVRCYSAEMQMRAHVGYELPSSHVDDLRLLHARFGISYPDGIAVVDEEKA